MKGYFIPQINWRMEKENYKALSRALGRQIKQFHGYCKPSNKDGPHIHSYCEQSPWIYRQQGQKDATLRPTPSDSMVQDYRKSVSLNYTKSTEGTYKITEPKIIYICKLLCPYTYCIQMVIGIH